MKKFKFQKQLEALKDSDFLDGWFDSWQIWTQEHEFSLPNHYMKCGFDSEQSATAEMERIKRQYPKTGRSLYKIEVKKVKVRRLKKNQYQYRDLKQIWHTEL